jgi:hypothetical protein
MDTLINKGHFIIPCIFECAEIFENGKEKLNKTELNFL